METTKGRLAEAIRLIKEGQKEAGENVLSNLLTLQPDLEVAWLWLADCAESPERKIYCLQKAFEINPHRPKVRQVLGDLSALVEANSYSHTQAPETISQLDAPARLPEENPPVQEVKAAPTAKPVTPTKKKTKPAAKHEKTQSGGTKDKGGAKKEKPSKVDRAAENSRDITQASNRKGTQKQKSGEPEVGEPHKIPFSFQPPTLILVKPEDDMFAERYWSRNRFLRTDTAMYGYTLIADGVRITPKHQPRCLKLGYILDDARCESCDYFSYYDCIFKDFPELIDEVKIFLDAAQQQGTAYHERKNAVIRAIYQELKAHGRPLHYSVLARIVTARHPHLNLSERGVLRTMTWHPEIFENVSEGVYQCHRRRKI